MAEQADYVCQIHITASQAAILSAACSHGATEPDLHPGAAQALLDLASFLNGVAMRPQDFPPSGAMARTLKINRRRAKPHRSKAHRANFQRMEAERTTRTFRAASTS